MAKSLEPAQISRRTAIAGALAGATTSVILHPIDTAKTVRQAAPKATRGLLIPTLVQLVQRRGYGALYAGAIPAILGSAPSSALYFGTYEFLRATLLAMRRGPPRLACNMIAAATGNLVSSIFFVPKEVIKQRMQTGQFGTQLIPALREMTSASNGGIASLYAGYHATLLRNVPSNMLRFSVYEELKAILRKRATGKPEQDGLSVPQQIVVGAVAGMFASGATTPMDVVKTRFATASRSKPSTSLYGLVREIVRHEGPSGLFVGLRARLVWSALFSSIGFSTYEIFKRWTLRDNLGVRPVHGDRNAKDGELVDHLHSSRPYRWRMSLW